MDDARTAARDVVIASYLGWTLDAFDFFIMIFAFAGVAQTFQVSGLTVTIAITLTLAMRPVGAFIFGRLGDHFGRRPILMIDVLMFSAFELLSAFAPTMGWFLVFRALYGVAMGGEWGLGASLTMETIPASWRGWVSGLLQAGYPSGYFLATIVFGALYPIIGWRGMFVVGVLPALLVFYIRARVPESPTWEEGRKLPRARLVEVLSRHVGLAIYVVILMTAFNFFSHGSQDLYPVAFLQDQLKFSHSTVTAIALAYNAGAIIGGLAFGQLSQRIGRRWAIVIAAVLALPLLPWWAFGTTPLEVGFAAFFMQVMVQGAWGVIPVHLNELSPPEVRATFPGFTYQLGNFLASANATIQYAWADALGHDLRWPLAGTIAIVAIVIAVMVAFGVERHSVAMRTASAPG
ncbi:MAG: MFS transporter [Acetobacteraceae bacterium]|nr:MFS transporter [Acetobacteraceae bacterium]